MWKYGNVRAKYAFARAKIKKNVWKGKFFLLDVFFNIFDYKN
jgi:hypothetical protein